MHEASRALSFYSCYYIIQFVQSLLVLLVYTYFMDHTVSMFKISFNFQIILTQIILLQKIYHSSLKQLPLLFNNFRVLYLVIFSTKYYYLSTRIKKIIFKNY